MHKVFADTASWTIGQRVDSSGLPPISLSGVEEYEAGVAGQDIDTEGKPTTWGRMKAGK